MSRDEEAKTARLFDKRTIERNIKKGLTNRKDYDKFLKALPDAADKVAPPEQRADEEARDREESAHEAHDSNGV